MKLENSILYRENVGLYRDNGKENGNYLLGLRDHAVLWTARFDHPPKESVRFAVSAFVVKKATYLPN